METLYIVDDDPELCTVLEQFLDGHFQVTTYSNPDDALDAIKAQQPDVVLTDIEFPGISAAEMVSIIKQINPNLPIFLMSGHHQAHPAVTDALDAGAISLIEKPFTDLDAFIATISSYPSKISAA